MSEKVFPIQEADLAVAELYKDFLPKRIFDAHTHLHRGEDLPNFYRKPGMVFIHERGTYETYLDDMAPMLPGVEEVKLNSMPMLDWAMSDPENGMRDAANDHVVEQHKAHPEQIVVSPFVLPGDSEEKIYALADQPGIRGLKCYSYGVRGDNVEALGIGDFLPETAWVVANERHLSITLHMMRPQALSDPDNFAYIEEMTHRYPNAQLILAHCARAFAAWTGIDAIKRLDDRGNIWFDMAAICESGPMMACIMKNAGKRTMWGSDYPVCMHRGRAVSVGTGSQWLTGDTFSMINGRSYLAAENLLAFKQAASLLDLDQTQIEDLFYNNACNLFGGGVNGTGKRHKKGCES